MSFCTITTRIQKQTFSVVEWGGRLMRLVCFVTRTCSPCTVHTKNESYSKRAITIIWILYVCQRYEKRDRQMQTDRETLTMWCDRGLLFRAKLYEMVCAAHRMRVTANDENDKSIQYCRDRQSYERWCHPRCTHSDVCHSILLALDFVHEK